MSVETTPRVEIQEPTVKDQAAKVLTQIAGYAGTRTIEIGLAHGLIETLARYPDGLTSEQLAVETGLDHFNVDVWCRAGLAHEILQRTDGGALRLAPHFDTVLLDRESPAYVVGTLMVLEQPEVFDDFGASVRERRANLVGPDLIGVHRGRVPVGRCLLRPADPGRACDRSPVSTSASVPELAFSTRLAGQASGWSGWRRRFPARRSSAPTAMPIH